MMLEKTQLKLFESKEGGNLIGFVSRHSKTGKLLGVREETYHGKKICVLAAHLQGVLKPDVLYEVFVKPMHSGAGFVIMAANRLAFPAYVETNVIYKSIYNVTVTFGNMVVFFDPICGKTPSSTTVEGVIRVLSRRNDIEDKEDVIEEFTAAATKLISRMICDGVLYNNKV